MNKNSKIETESRRTRYEEWLGCAKCLVGWLFGWLVGWIGLLWLFVLSFLSTFLHKKRIAFPFLPGYS